MRMNILICIMSIIAGILIMIFHKNIAERKADIDEKFGVLLGSIKTYRWIIFAIGLVFFIFGIWFFLEG